MKKFKFSLEAVLKIRALKEQECKARIGRVQIEIEQIKSSLKAQDQSIVDIYISQEELLSRGLTGQELKFYPYFLSGKEAHISQLKSQLKIKEEELLEMLSELAQKRADLKVLSNMKDKKKKLHKKEVLKKETQALEELVQNWAQSNKELP